MWCYGNTETFTITAAYPSDTSPEIADGSHGEALPGNTLKVEQAMVSMLAGDVFDSPRVWWRLQLFKLIYLGTWLSLWRRSLRPREPSRSPPKRLTQTLRL